MEDHTKYYSFLHQIIQFFSCMTDFQKEISFYIHVKLSALFNYFNAQKILQI